MTKDTQYTNQPLIDRIRPPQISMWNVNELLNEVVRIKQKKSKLSRSERETVKTNLSV